MARRERYEEYLASQAWREKRRRYFAAKRLPKTCLACGSEQVQLHHRTYRRLGREHLQDLVPLCQPCHSAGHDLIRRGGAKSIYRVAKRLARVRSGVVPLSELPEGWKPPASWDMPTRQPKAERWQDVLKWPVR